jgi:hypothetical protein
MSAKLVISDGFVDTALQCASNALLDQRVFDIFDPVFSFGSRILQNELVLKEPMDSQIDI